MAEVPSKDILERLNKLINASTESTNVAFQIELDKLLNSVNNLQLNEAGRRLSILDRVRIIDAWHDLLKRSGWLRLGTNESTAMQNCSFKWETLTSMVLWRTVDKYFTPTAEVAIFPMCLQTGTYPPATQNGVSWPLRYNQGGAAGGSRNVSVKRRNRLLGGLRGRPTPQGLYGLFDKFLEKLADVIVNGLFTTPDPSYGPILSAADSSRISITGPESPTCKRFFQMLNIYPGYTPAGSGDVDRLVNIPYNTALARSAFNTKVEQIFNKDVYGKPWPRLIGWTADANRGYMEQLIIFAGMAPYFVFFKTRGLRVDSAGSVGLKTTMKGFMKLIIYSFIPNLKPFDVNPQSRDKLALMFNDNGLPYSQINQSFELVFDGRGTAGIMTGGGKKNKQIGGKSTIVFDPLHYSSSSVSTIGLGMLAELQDVITATDDTGVFDTTLKLEELNTPKFRVDGQPKTTTKALKQLKSVAEADFRKLKDGLDKSTKDIVEPLAAIARELGISRSLTIADGKLMGDATQVLEALCAFYLPGIWQYSFIFVTIDWLAYLQAILCGIPCMLFSAENWQTWAPNIEGFDADGVPTFSRTTDFKDNPYPPEGAAVRERIFREATERIAMLLADFNGRARAATPSGTSSSSASSSGPAGVGRTERTRAGMTGGRTSFFDRLRAGGAAILNSLRTAINGLTEAFPMSYCSVTQAAVTRAAATGMAGGFNYFNNDATLTTLTGTSEYERYTRLLDRLGHPKLYTDDAELIVTIPANEGNGETGEAVLNPKDFVGDTRLEETEIINKSDALLQGASITADTLNYELFQGLDPGLSDILRKLCALFGMVHELEELNKNTDDQLPAMTGTLEVAMETLNYAFDRLFTLDSLLEDYIYTFIKEGIHVLHATMNHNVVSLVYDGLLAKIDGELAQKMLTNALTLLNDVPGDTSTEKVSLENIFTQQNTIIAWALLGEAKNGAALNYPIGRSPLLLLFFYMSSKYYNKDNMEGVFMVNYIKENIKDDISSLISELNDLADAQMTMQARQEAAAAAGLQEAAAAAGLQGATAATGTQEASAAVPSSTTLLSNKQKRKKLLEQLPPNIKRLVKDSTSNLTIELVLNLLKKGNKSLASLILNKLATPSVGFASKFKKTLRKSRGSRLAQASVLATRRVKKKNPTQANIEESLLGLRSLYGPGNESAYGGFRTRKQTKRKRASKTRRRNKIDIANI